MKWSLFTKETPIERRLVEALGEEGIKRMLGSPEMTSLLYDLQWVVRARGEECFFSSKSEAETWCANAMIIPDDIRRVT